MHISGIIAKLTKVTALCLLFMPLNSCNESDCLSSGGEKITEVIYSGEFNSVQIFDTFDVYCVQDSLNKVEVELEETYIKNIFIENDGSSLKISNKNKCRFLKSSGNIPKIILHFSSLDSAIFYESGRFFSDDTIKNSRFLLRFVSEAGYCDFIVNTNHLAVSVWGEGNTGEFKVRGKTDYFQVLTDGTSFLYADDLISDFVHITNFSVGNIYVQAQKTISASIYCSGNVFYKGNPEILNYTTYNSGKMIENNN